MDNNSISYTKWNCTYYIVFIPKYRKKVLYGKVRKDLVGIIRKLCEMKKIELIKGAVCADHVHLYLAIPQKLSISDVVAYIKGKSALMIYDAHPEPKCRWGERHLWARGYYVEPVGNVNEETDIHLGTAETNHRSYSYRLKRQGRVWSHKGLENMAAVLIAPKMMNLTEHCCIRQAVGTTKRRIEHLIQLCEKL